MDDSVVTQEAGNSSVNQYGEASSCVTIDSRTFSPTSDQRGAQHEAWLEDRNFQRVCMCQREAYFKQWENGIKEDGGFAPDGEWETDNGALTCYDWEDAPHNRLGPREAREVHSTLIEQQRK